MKFRKLLPIAAPLALIGCGDSKPEEAPPLPPIEEAQPVPAEVPQEEAYDETVVEVEPDLDAAAPMETGMPMADAAPMTDDVGGEEGGEGEVQ